MAKRLHLAALSGLVVLLLSAHSVAQTPPRLWVMGTQVSLGNTVTVTLASDAVGSPALLVVGLFPLPLDAPVITAKGPLYFGQFMLTFPFGVVPASQRIDVPLALPPADPVLEGIQVVLQGFVGGELSNPATLPLMPPHHLPADALVISNPLPGQALYFGDRVAIGDLNADGHDDLIAGAWISKVNGLIGAGLVFVMWGPDFTDFTQLTPPSPVFAAGFGGAVVVADLDLDGTDDLVVSQSTGSPANGKQAFLYVYYGGPAFSSTPTLTIPSAGTGPDYLVFGRSMAIGDVNDDGFPDLVAGITNAQFGLMTNAGRVDIYFGPDFTGRQAVRSALPGANDFFGSSVALADVDGDGRLDLVEGSGRTDVGGVVNIGRMEVFYGPSLLTASVIECPLPDGFNTRFGDPLLVSDVHGGPELEIVTRDGRDHAYVVSASAFDTYLLVTRPRSASEPAVPSETFGAGFISAGDVNGDSFADLVLSDEVAGPATGCGLSSKGGWVYISYGPYHSTFARFWEVNPACDELFGGFVKYVKRGDLDGDLIVSNPTGKVIGHIILYQ